ncbi:MAG: hypothetical protein IJJ03_01940 [Mogibacterium sp.]|nr:hypothetical protein [Mogibacterium sp.]
MAIIKQYHKDTDTTYVYESISYWDAEKGQSRSKRKVIGKVDPATGEVVPTGKRGRKKKAQGSTDVNNSEEFTKMTALYEQSKAEVAELRMENSRLSGEVSTLIRQNEKLLAILQKAQDLLATADR